MAHYRSWEGYSLMRGGVRIERLHGKAKRELVLEELLGSRKAGNMWMCSLGTGQICSHVWVEGIE